MKISIFTKLFIAHAVFILAPLVTAAGLIVIKYEKTVGGFFVGKSPSEISTLSQDLLPILSNLRLQFIVIIVAMAILSLLSSLLVTQILVGPVKKMIIGIREVGNGNLDFKIESRSKDELGESAKYFNEMINRLRKARLAMQEAKDTLKIKVTDKTKELEELVKNRDLIIQTKTKELQDRVEELEKMHKLSVGRELKMVELKKETEALREKLNKKIS